MKKKIKKTLLFCLTTLTLVATCASSVILTNKKQTVNNKSSNQDYNIGTISSNSNKTTNMASFISSQSNASNNNDSVLNNVTLPAHLFSNSNLSAYNSNFKDASFFINNNNSETNNPFNYYVNNEKNKIINYIENHGLQKNGFSSLLENELNIPKSFVNKNILNNNTISLNYTSYLWEWINWNSLYWLNSHSLQDTIEAFNDISSTTPWKFFKIQINNQAISNNYYYHFIKSITLTNISNNIYEISISTQPDFNITLNSNYIKDGNYKINININGTNNIPNSNTNNNSLTLNSINTTNNQQNTLIDNLNNEIKEIQEKLFINVRKCAEYDYTTMTERRLLAWEESEYIKVVTNNSSLSSEAFNDWNTMNGYYHWTLDYWNIINRSYDYKEFMIYISDISNMYHSEYMKYDSTPPSPLLILNNKISQLSAVVSSEKKNGQFILNVSDMTQARLLAWEECEYIKDIGSISLANSNFNVWYEMNNYYHLTINGMNHWNKETGWYFIQFCFYLKEIQSAYNTSSNPYSTGLDLMQKAIITVNRYAAEEEGVAIAASVATAVSIAIAAAYWAGSWFFGITVPEAIAATTAAISTASTMAGMWTSYHATQTLQTDIKDNTFSWMSLKSDKSFYSKMKKDWKTFKKYFTKTYKAIRKTVKVITALQDVTVDTCSWADPILAVVGVADLALETSILFSNLVINAVNTTWLNELFIV